MDEPDFLLAVQVVARLRVSELVSAWRVAALGTA
jgi:hypothetical protein